jgi:hypothetical protein
MSSFPPSMLTNPGVGYQGRPVPVASNSSQMRASKPVSRPPHRRPLTTEKKREFCEYHVNNPNAKQADIGGKLAYSSSQTKDARINTSLLGQMTISDGGQHTKRRLCLDDRFKGTSRQDIPARTLYFYAECDLGGIAFSFSERSCQALAILLRVVPIIQGGDSNLIGPRRDTSQRPQVRVIPIIPILATFWSLKEIGSFW